MTTLAEFLNEAIAGSKDEAVAANFQDPKSSDPNAPWSAMNKHFKDGDFELKPSEFESARMLAKEIIDLAKQKGVKLEEMDDLKKAMGFDKNPRQLSQDELAAYLIGMSLADSSYKQMGTNIEMKDKFRTDANSDLALEFGKQVFGDNRPGDSKEVTTQPGLPKAIDDKLPVMRC